MHQHQYGLIGLSMRRGTVPEHEARAFACAPAPVRTDRLQHARGHSVAEGAGVSERELTC